MITYKGYEIVGNSGDYYVRLHTGHKVGSFRSYAECETYINGLRY